MLLTTYLLIHGMFSHYHQLALALRLWLGSADTKHWQEIRVEEKDVRYLLCPCLHLHSFSSLRLQQCLYLWLQLLLEPVCSVSKFSLGPRHNGFRPGMDFAFFLFLVPLTLPTSLEMYHPFPAALSVNDHYFCQCNDT